MQDLNRELNRWDSLSVKMPGVSFSVLVTLWLARTWWGLHWWPRRATASRATGTSWPPSASPRPHPASPRTPMCSENNAHVFFLLCTSPPLKPSLTVCTFWNFRAPYFDTPRGDFLGRPFYGKGNAIFRIERTIFGELFTGSYKEKALDIGYVSIYILYIVYLKVAFNARLSEIKLYSWRFVYSFIYTSKCMSYSFIAR